MARFCTECGKEIADGVAFCTECGTKAPMQEPVAPVQPPAPAVSQPTVPVNNTYTPPVNEKSEPAIKGTKYEPITTGGFIGILLLMSLPVIGIILTIIWACGGCRKITKRSFARAYLILMAVGMVIGLILTLIFNSFINSALGFGFKDLFNKKPTEIEQTEEKEENDINGLLGIIGALDGEDSNNDTSGLLGVLGAIQGAEDTEEGYGLDALLENIESENKEIEAKNDGWPNALRPYPGGTQTSVTTYRTEITDTTLEDMRSYINELKKDGYEYRDFYEFGFSEDQMLDMNGWWGTNGEIYLSLSYTEGTVIIDHTYELPDINDYFN